MRLLLVLCTLCVPIYSLLTVKCSDQTCLNGGICNSGADGNSFCICPKEFYGGRCEMSIECPRGPSCPTDSCPAGYCRNNGICRIDDGDPVCDCLENFQGAQCEYDVNECDNFNSCVNGKCLNTYGSYICSCDEGFYGSDCSLNYSQSCLSKNSPCQNGGKCTSSEGGKFKCECPHDFTGSRCQISLDFCANAPCQNHGACVNDIIGYGFTCFCTPGFFGSTCQYSKTDPCLNSICSRGSVCRPTTDYDAYSCVCINGSNASDCETVSNQIDKCTTSPCQNGGLCSMNGTEISCQCTTGYSGVHCEKADERLDRRPFDKCPMAECAAMFENGKCDETCNTEECLWDGYDCKEKLPQCPVACTGQYANGICDEECNTEACGYDGGDCDKQMNDILTGDLVVIVPLNNFISRINDIVLSLSRSLRSIVRIRRDDGGPMIYQWDNGVEGNRILLEEWILEQSRIAISSTPTDRGNASIHLEIGSKCHAGNCFSKLESVAGYLMASKDRDPNMPINEAYVYVKPQEDDSWGYIVVPLGIFCILSVGVILLIVQKSQQTRKRRMHAPIWHIPSEESLFTKADELVRSENEDVLKERWIKKKKIEQAQDPAIVIDLKHYEPMELVEPHRLTIQPKVEEPQYKLTLLHKEAKSKLPIKAPITEDVNALGPGRCTALHYCINNYEKKTLYIVQDVNTLIAAGVNMDIQNEDGATALLLACRRRLIGVVKILLDNKADPTIPNNNGATCLHQAISAFSVSVLELLLKYPDVQRIVDFVDNQMRTPLMVAMCDLYNTDMLDILKRNHADVNFDGKAIAYFRGFTGRTPLHFAVENNNINAIKWMTGAGDLTKRKVHSLDVQDVQGLTPLHLAATLNYEKIVIHLIAEKANYELKDVMGVTPLMIAKRECFTGIVKIIEDQMKKKKHPGKKERTKKPKLEKVKDDEDSDKEAEEEKNSPKKEVVPNIYRNVADEENNNPLPVSTDWNTPKRPPTSRLSSQPYRTPFQNYSLTSDLGTTISSQNTTVPQNQSSGYFESPGISQIPLSHPLVFPGMMFPNTLWPYPNIANMPNATPSSFDWSNV